MTSTMTLYRDTLQQLMVAQELDDNDVEEDRLYDILDHLWYKQMTAAERIEATAEALGLGNHNPKENTMQSTPFVNTSIFSSKQEYLAFKSAWRKLIADGKHEKVRVKVGASGRYVNGQYTQCEVFARVSPLTGLEHLARRLALGNGLAGFENAQYAKFGTRYGFWGTWPETKLLDYARGAFPIVASLLTDEQAITLYKRVVEVRSRIRAGDINFEAMREFFLAGAVQVGATPAEVSTAWAAARA